MTTAVRQKNAIAALEERIATRSARVRVVGLPRLSTEGPDLPAEDEIAAARRADRV
jgi:hypothetical protein